LLGGIPWRGLLHGVRAGWVLALGGLALGGRGLRVRRRLLRGVLLVWRGLGILARLLWRVSVLGWDRSLLTV
jgi:hypothetical protein